MPHMRANQKPKPKAPHPSTRGFSPAMRAARDRLVNDVSEKERKALEEGRRIQRELRTQKRIAALTRQLSRAAYHTQTRVFQLGRELVMDHGWSVVKPEATATLQAELERLRAREYELEEMNRRLTAELYELRKSNEDLRAELTVLEVDANVRGRAVMAGDA